ncbi:unnamed protein product [Timema podura]|uniref:Uncharacterized protein n=1 Tax=Timema podura TaxID=61482 RepID=A0ABN7PLK5_TIMPD|nr:unnamed protein product [Timema podura]
MLVVPIPYLDDPLHPRALAVPLRHSHLLSLLSEQSVHVLSHYYLAAVRCLAGQPNSAGQLAGFHDNLNNWLHKFVSANLNSGSCGLGRHSRAIRLVSHSPSRLMWVHLSNYTSLFPGWMDTVHSPGERLGNKSELDPMCVQVLPRLEDDLWYPGFGGVLQILETLKRSGVDIRGHWGAEPMEDPVLPPPEPQPWSPVEEEELGLRLGKVELSKTHSMFLPGTTSTTSHSTDLDNLTLDRYSL